MLAAAHSLEHEGHALLWGAADIVLGALVLAGSLVYLAMKFLIA
jgi:hypothetical protein